MASSSTSQIPISSSGLLNIPQHELNDRSLANVMYSLLTLIFQTSPEAKRTQAVTSRFIVVISGPLWLYLVHSGYIWSIYSGYFGFIVVLLRNCALISVVTFVCAADVF